ARWYCFRSQSAWLGTRVVSSTSELNSDPRSTRVDSAPFSPASRQEPRQRKRRGAAECKPARTAEAVNGFQDPHDRISYQGAPQLVVGGCAAPLQGLTVSAVPQISTGIMAP